MWIPHECAIILPNSNKPIDWRSGPKGERRQPCQLSDLLLLFLGWGCCLDMGGWLQIWSDDDASLIGNGYFTTDLTKCRYWWYRGDWTNVNWRVIAELDSRWRGVFWKAIFLGFLKEYIPDFYTEVCTKCKSKWDDGEIKLILIPDPHEIIKRRTLS